MRVGWIGTGLMGHPMCRRLLAADHDLVIHNRTRTRAEPVLADGARWAESPAAAVVGRDVVITMLPYPADIEAVYLGADGLIAAAAAPTVLVDMSTSPPGLARLLAETGQHHGIDVVDAPVSGGPDGAAAGTLSIMVGGPTPALNAVQPVLETLGITIVHHGPAGAGQSAKLVNQVLIGGIMAGIAEAYCLAEILGLDPAADHTSVGQGAASSFLLDFAWPRLAAGDLTPGFKAAHLRKDLGLAVEAAAQQGLILPATRLVAELYQRLIADGRGEQGTQALAVTIASPPNIKEPS